MLSSSDLERLIAVKKIEIDEEKMQLGLTERKPPPIQDDKENAGAQSRPKKQVNFTQHRALCDNNGVNAQSNEKVSDGHQEHEDKIPPDLDRYIRRYLGLPVMLKAGEYSPNNPLIRSERAPGDALLGLGEYERQRNTLRRIRQQQYREYLDQQAKKKQEAKEQSERERREREEREREREQRGRELLLERDRRSPERRRADHAPVTSTVYCSSKVDTGVQVDGFSRPLSVAVQTDEAELFRLSPSPSKSQMTPAERELSPRTVGEALVAGVGGRPPTYGRRRSYGDYDDGSSTVMKKSNRDKLTSELRHSYMPSIFDADAIRLRNQQAEQEAAERRQYYQQELKNQIMEQQRIREERKNREKMLEQAEMRRLEEQLRMLRVAQDRELGRQHVVTAAMRENTSEYNHKRTELQKVIDMEQQNLLRAAQSTRSNTHRNTQCDNISKLPFYYPKTHTSTTPERIIKEKKPFSTNIPDNSIFSTNYDVDSYLRRNLNFNKDKISNLELENDRHRSDNIRNIRNDSATKHNNGNDFQIIKSNPRNDSSNVKMSASNSTVKEANDNDDIVYKPSGNERQPSGNEYKPSGNERQPSGNEYKPSGNEYQPSGDAYKPSGNAYQPSGNEYQPSGNEYQPFGHEYKPSGKEYQPSGNTVDPLPIPVLKHTPSTAGQSDSNMSYKMKLVDDKWKVPVIQKNILKNIPNDEGKNVSILTQLGSIRRQLQLEQLKLDGMLNKDDL